MSLIAAQPAAAQVEPAAAYAKVLLFLNYLKKCDGKLDPSAEKSAVEAMNKLKSGGKVSASEISQAEEISAEFSRKMECNPSDLPVAREALKASVAQASAVL